MAHRLHLAATAGGTIAATENPLASPATTPAKRPSSLATTLVTTPSSARTSMTSPPLDGCTIAAKADYTATTHCISAVTSPTTTPVKPPTSPAMTPVTSPQQRQVLISALMLLEKKYPDMDEDERLLRAGRHARARAHVTTSSAARARVEQARPELDPIVKELMVTHLTNFADGPEGLDLILKALEDDEIDMPALRLINPAELMEFGIAEGPTIAILQAVEKDRLLKAVEKDQLEKKKRRRARRTPSFSLDRA